MFQRTRRVLRKWLWRLGRVKRYDVCRIACDAELPLHRSCTAQPQWRGDCPDQISFNSLPMPRTVCKNRGFSRCTTTRHAGEISWVFTAGPILRAARRCLRTLRSSVRSGSSPVKQGATSLVVKHQSSKSVTTVQRPEGAIAISTFWRPKVRRLFLLAILVYALPVAAQQTRADSIKLVAHPYDPARHATVALLGEDSLGIAKGRTRVAAAQASTCS